MNSFAGFDLGYTGTNRVTHRFPYFRAVHKSHSMVPSPPPGPARDKCETAQYVL